MRTETILKIPSLWLVDVLEWRPLIGCRENAHKINLSQAASCMILQNHRRLPVCIFSVKIATALGSLKQVIGRILKNWKWSQRSKLNLSLTFSSTWKQKIALYSWLWHKVVDCRSGPPAYVAWRYDNPVPELTLSPQSGTMNLASAFNPNYKGKGVLWGRPLLLVVHICICLRTSNYFMSIGKGRVRERGREGVGADFIS